MKIAHHIALACIVLTTPSAFCPLSPELAEEAGLLVSLIPPENFRAPTLFDKNIEYCALNADKPWAWGILKLVSDIYKLHASGSAQLELLHPIVRSTTNTACSVFNPEREEPRFKRLEKMLSLLEVYQKEISRYHGLLCPGSFQRFHVPATYKALYETHIQVYEAFSVFYIEQGKIFYKNNEDQLIEEASRFPEAARFVALPTNNPYLLQLSSRPQFFHPDGLYIVNNTRSADLGTIYEIGKSAENQVPLIHVRAELAPHRYGITPTKPFPSETTPAARRQSSKQVCLFGDMVTCAILNRPPMSGSTSEGYYYVEAPGEFYDAQVFFVSPAGEVTKLDA